MSSIKPTSTPTDPSPTIEARATPTTKGPIKGGTGGQGGGSTEPADHGGKGASQPTSGGGQQPPQT